MYVRVIIIQILVFSIIHSYSQELKIQSGFIQDSTGVGEELAYWITASYPLDEEVLFPDSNFNFRPYEFLDKYYSETIIRESYAFDSAVYVLQSFEIDPVQYLSLPVIQIKNGDSLIYDTPTDSVFFRELAPVVSDTTQLKTNVNYLDVSRQFNYPLWGIILIFLGVVGLVIFLIYGKKIRRMLLIRKMRKDFRLFSDEFTNHIRLLKNNYSPEKVEAAASLWKHYMEKLEREPFRKLTTTEILKYPFTGEISDSLRMTDRSIYGKEAIKDIYKHFQVLEDFTSHRYSMKIGELKDGK